MSAALVRQALDFVDPDESKTGSKKKRGGRSQGAAGQEAVLKTETKFVDKKQTKKRSGDSKETEVISKLLKLSHSTVDRNITKKIVERAVSGKPVFDKIEVKKEEPKSILFPDDDPPKTKKIRKHKKRY